jgi:hypothetical protein
VSNYTKATNFATKDSLETGNASKIIKGTEIDTEFNAISSAITSKSDTASPTFTGTPAAPTASVGTDTSQIATTAFVQDALGTISTTGRIVQIVESVSSTGVDSTSGTLVGTGHTATITPSSSSNKILVLMSFGFAQTNLSASNGTNAFWSLYRGATNLGTGAGFGVNCLGMAAVNTSGNTSSVYIQESYQFLDSPATTSSTTYQTYVRVSGNASAGYNTMGNARIILLEISQ